MSPRGGVRGVQVLVVRWIPRTPPRDDKNEQSSDGAAEHGGSGRRYGAKVDDVDDGVFQVGDAPGFVFLALIVNPTQKNELSMAINDSGCRCTLCAKEFG